MRKRDKERLALAEQAAAVRAERLRPRTWQDLRNERNMAVEAVRKVFGWEVRDVPDEPQEFWEEQLREEQETAKAIRDMTETEANGYIIGRVFGRAAQEK